LKKLRFNLPSTFEEDVTIEKELQVDGAITTIHPDGESTEFQVATKKYVDDAQNTGPQGPQGPGAEGGSGGVTWIEKNESYTLAINEGVLADTTSDPLTITLPPTPSIGDTVGISDAKGNFNTNNLTIARNGSLIHGLEENLICNLNNISFNLVYT
jgi:hypothetical protein